MFPTVFKGQLLVQILVKSFLQVTGHWWGTEHPACMLEVIWESPVWWFWDSPGTSLADGDCCGQPKKPALSTALCCRETQNLTAFSGDIRNGHTPGSAEELQWSLLGNGFPNWGPGQHQEVPALTTCQNQGCPSGSPWVSQALYDLPAPSTPSLFQAKSSSETHPRVHRRKDWGCLKMRSCPWHLAVLEHHDEASPYICSEVIISLPYPKKTRGGVCACACVKTHWTMKFLNPHPMRRINVALSLLQYRELPVRDPIVHYTLARVHLSACSFPEWVQSLTRRSWDFTHPVHRRGAEQANHHFAAVPQQE